MAINIIGRLEGCGLGQGQETLVGSTQVMESWHTMPQSVNFVLQTLGVVDMGER